MCHPRQYTPPRRPSRALWVLAGVSGVTGVPNTEREVRYNADDGDRRAVAERRTATPPVAPTVPPASRSASSDRRLTLALFLQDLCGEG